MIAFVLAFAALFATAQPTLSARAGAEIVHAQPIDTQLDRGVMNGARKLEVRFPFQGQKDELAGWFHRGLDGHVTKADVTIAVPAGKRSYSACLPTAYRTGTATQQAGRHDTITLSCKP